MLDAIYYIACHAPLLLTLSWLLRYALNKSATSDAALILLLDYARHAAIAAMLVALYYAAYAAGAFMLLLLHTLPR